MMQICGKSWSFFPYVWWDNMTASSWKNKLANNNKNNLSSLVGTLLVWHITFSKLSSLLRSHMFLRYMCCIQTPTHEYKMIWNSPKTNNPNISPGIDTTYQKFNAQRLLNLYHCTHLCNHLRRRHIFSLKNQHKLTFCHPNRILMALGL